MDKSSRQMEKRMAGEKLAKGRQTESRQTKMCRQAACGEKNKKLQGSYVQQSRHADR
jgi:hypothetical protein